MKAVKKTGCVVLTALLLLGCCGFGASAGAAEHRRGEVIEFGEYPQARVTDEALTAALEIAAEDAQWQPQGYTASADTEYSFFKDVELDGVMYRAIRFTRYYGGAQARYGYQTDTVYWFRFEPIRWTVLDPESGLLIASEILDVQPISNVVYDAQYADPDRHYYLNNYAHGSIRGWLNGAFTDAAFSEAEAETIVLREQDNSLSDMDGTYAQYACENTSDNVFLLSYAEVGNETWFPDDASRIRVGTAYARSLGLQNYHDVDPEYYPDNDFWFLRSPGLRATTQGYVHAQGSLYSDMDSYSFDVGVCPAVYIDLEAYDRLNEPSASPYDGLTFSFEDGILTVSGSGAVPTAENAAETPFASYAGECAVLMIEDGIEAVRADAFPGLDGLEMLILRGQVELEENAFAQNENIRTVICADSVRFSETSFAPDAAITVYEPKALPHSGELPSNCAVLPYSFTEGTLYIEGAAQMDTYGLLDLMAVMCGYYSGVGYVRFDSYTSLDAPFYVYDKSVKEYVPAENNTLTGVRFSVKVPAGQDWDTVSFNEFCDLAASGGISTFRLVADLEIGEDPGEDPGEGPSEGDVQENVFQIVERAVKKVLRWITTLLNKLFGVFSKV